MRDRWLRSTITGEDFPFGRLAEFSPGGESLEVAIGGIEDARIRQGSTPCERFRDFLPFDPPLERFTLGEGSTPLLGAGKALCDYIGTDAIRLKNETVNPTWSFKDRGSVACVAMCAQMGESVTATISTGNMGQSMAAYGARAGLGVMVFVPSFTPKEKILSMAFHGAHVLRVGGCDYADMKSRVLAMADGLGLRIVSGNGPIRVEGYKLTAFELYEQFGRSVPDFIAVPSSACGHIRGIFKGFRELLAAGYTDRLPRMIVVQAANNSPLVTAIRSGSKTVVPFRDFTTVAEALTSGNPPGGDEILDKAARFSWLAESSSEEEILDSQRRLAAAGFFVEPGTATLLAAVRKLVLAGSIRDGQSVVLMLTGSGMKDMDVLLRGSAAIDEVAADGLESAVTKSYDELKRRFTSARG